MDPLPWSITVDVTTDLSTQLHQLSNTELGSDTLDDTLLALTANLEAAVPSYLGLQLTIIENAWPVILTAIRPDPVATTSLRLPLAVLGPHFDPQSRVTLYATIPGAFVDLAADLGYARHLPTATNHVTDEAGNSTRHGPRNGGLQIALDADLPPSTRISGMSGLAELSTINRAIGILLGQGHRPDRASETLRRNAFQQALNPYTHAA